MQFEDNINYYNILGIDSKATQDDIKKAFRKLSLIYHPDRDTGDNEKFKNIAEGSSNLFFDLFKLFWVSFAKFGFPNIFGNFQEF